MLVNDIAQGGSDRKNRSTAQRRRKMIESEGDDDDGKNRHKGCTSGRVRKCME